MRDGEGNPASFGAGGAKGEKEMNPFTMNREAREWLERARRAYRRAKDSGDFFPLELEGMKEEIECAKAEVERTNKLCDEALRRTK